MQRETVNGQCCGLYGCTSVSVEDIGGHVECYADNMSYSEAMAERIWYDTEVIADTLSDMSADADELGNRLSLTAALLCKTAQGEWEFLAVEEGQVIDINGEKIMVRRY